MKVIYVGLQKENYDNLRNFGFEYSNFYLTMKNMPSLEVIEYPLDLIIEKGKKKFNDDLLELVKKEKPDLLFSFMFTDELDKKILKEIKNLTTSVAWFADDSWRFYNYTHYWASYFSYLVTTYSWVKGENIIRSQWGCNQNIWKPINVRRDIDISFVGQYNSEREKIINVLRDNGINVFVRGLGWPEGRVSQQEMIEVFSRSKINLNINSQISRFNKKSLGRLILKRSVDKFIPSFDLINNFKSWLCLSIPQIKARPFELAACKTFVISGFADDLDKFYKENEEMVFYHTTDELIEKIRHYLPLEAEREKIAEAGYQRTLREHTYEQRFKNIFKAVGLNYNG
ncbi:MAG: glycosyltransferase [Patescibacteria group bacterium]